MGKGRGPLLILILIVIVAAVAYWLLREEEVIEVPVAVGPPFGSETDIADANAVWEYMTQSQLAGPGVTVANLSPGDMPHGELLETVTVDAEIGGHSGALIIKKNFAGDGITADQVIADPDAYLVAVTVMFQREDGYDADHGNWFWAKYLTGGALDKNPGGMQLAGRVGRVATDGATGAGCLGCHANAPGNDWIFTN